MVSWPRTQRVGTLKGAAATLLPSLLVLAVIVVVAVAAVVEAQLT